VQIQGGNDGRDGNLKSGAANSTASARLLVIDDVAVHRMIICKAAQKVGYAALEAGNVSEAVDLADNVDLACVTLDLSLGERAGVEVLRRLAELGRKTPVIIISGADLKGTQAAFDFGVSLGLTMQAPISKPVDLVKLRETLAEVELKWRVHRHSFASVA
jgi:CheY-like chemotaxis protein